MREGEDRPWGVKTGASGPERCSDILTLLFTIIVTLSKACPFSASVPHFFHL